MEAEVDSRRDTSSKITQIDSSEPFFYNFDTEVLLTAPSA